MARFFVPILVIIELRLNFARKKILPWPWASPTGYLFHNDLYSDYNLTHVWLSNDSLNYINLIQNSGDQRIAAQFCKKKKSFYDHELEQWFMASPTGYLFQNDSYSESNLTRVFDFRMILCLDDLNEITTFINPQILLSKVCTVQI